MERNPHYFWAVRIPDNVKQIIHNELTRVKPTFPFKRWVGLNDYHITLVFLGSVNKEQLSSIINNVSDAIKEQKAFVLDILGLGIFGAQASPRIFWGRVNEVRGLYQLQEIVHKTCLAEGFPLDSRPYHPHITFARKWGGDKEFKVDNLTTQNPFEKGLSFQVNKIVLYKSNLDSTPKYQPIATFTLED